MLFLVTMLLAAQSAYSQQGVTWIGLSADAGYGSGYLFNSQAYFGDDNVSWSFFSPSMNYGGSLNFSFNDGFFYVRLEGSAMSLSQVYGVNNGSTLEDHQANLDMYNFGLVFKLRGNSGLYAEFGPQYSMLKSAVLDGNDVSQHLAPKFSSAVLGIGFMPYSGQFVEVSLGVRAVASLGGIVVDDYNFYQDSPNAGSYATNNVFSVAFMPVIDVNFLIAYMGRASCGAFRVMLNSGSGTRKVKIRR